ARGAHRRAAGQLRRALVLLRVLPTEERRGRAQARGGARRALAPGADVRVGHLRRGRDGEPEAQDDRDRRPGEARPRPGGDGALHLRGGDRLGAALDARADAGDRHRQRPRAARRPASGRDGLAGHRRRPDLLARADRAHPRRVRLRHRRRVLPGGPRPRQRRRERPALHEGEGRRGRSLPDHPAVLRQRALLRLRRPRPRHGHRRPDHPGHHADHQLRAAAALHRPVRGGDPRRPARGARGPRRRSRRGGRLRSRLRDAAVRRPPGQRRAGYPLLHAQPLAGDARHPLRSAHDGALARQRRRL
ncbi:MAG: 5,10-methylenetetrahydrofolate reductase, partial [uncultured Solirubrobacteraceae bacterium]